VHKGGRHYSQCGNGWDKGRRGTRGESVTHQKPCNFCEQAAFPAHANSVQREISAKCLNAIRAWGLAGWRRSAKKEWTREEIRERKYGTIQRQKRRAVDGEKVPKITLNKWGGRQTAALDGFVEKRSDQPPSPGAIFASTSHDLAWSTEGKALSRASPSPPGCGKARAHRSSR
jgi:hypothetical protein